MLKTVTLATALLAISAGSAAAQGLQVSYPSDATMDCAALSAESARMDQLMADANAQTAKADGSARGAGLASTLAVEGLARSGMLGRVPGVGMFANNAANMAKQRAEQVRAAAAETVQIATTRKALMGGLWTGKGCDAPAPAPVVEAEPAQAAAPGA
jgi:hypothetical protein